MLLSIVKTDSFLEQIDFDSDTLFYKETISFEDKEKLQRIVRSKTTGLERQLYDGTNQCKKNVDYYLSLICRF